MNFSYFIAKRYLFSKSSTNAINIITVIAAVGVLISTIVLFLLLSHFSGLRKFNEKYLRVSDPDIRISSKKGKILDYTKEIENKLKKLSSIDLFSRVVEEKSFLQKGEKKVIAKIKGVDQNYNHIIMIDTCITYNDYGAKTLNWLDKESLSSAILGDDLILKLNLSIEPENIFQVMIPKAGKGFINPTSSYNSKTLFLYAGFRGFEDFNSTMFVNIEIAQNLLDLKPEQISFIDIKIKDDNDTEDVRYEIEKLFGNAYKVETREQLNEMFYKVMNIENFFGYLIATLITIIALFNILGSIIMIIVDKKDNLNTLFKMGALVKDIKRIFVLQGFLLTFIGTLLGLTIAISIVLIQNATHMFMMTENQPYLVRFNWFNVIVVFVTVTILGYCAAKIASSRISEDFVSK